MKEFIKRNSKYILIVMICVFGSYLTTLATNYAFESTDVRFDNTNTEITARDVQGALEQTFQHVTDYNDIKDIIGSGTLTTTNKTLIGGINELSNLTAYDVLWTGDAHTTGEFLELTHPVTDYKKILFIWNVIPNRTPSFDVPSDGFFYPEIFTGTVWDVSCSSAKVVFSIGKQGYSDATNKKLKTANYYSNRVDSYVPAIVKIIGFKTY